MLRLKRNADIGLSNGTFQGKSKFDIDPQVGHWECNATVKWYQFLKARKIARSMFRYVVVTAERGMI